MGISPNTPQRWWRHNPAPTISKPPKQRQWRRQFKSQELHRKEAQYQWRRRDGPALSHVVDHGCLLLTMTPVTVPTSTYRPHFCTSSQPPNIRSTLHETPFVQGREIAQCRGYLGSSEWIWVYGVGASVMRFPWYMYTTVLSWKLQVRCSPMSAIYAGE